VNNRWRWALGASIALNVFLVALIASHLVGHRHGEKRPKPTMRIDSLAATLPAADGDKLRAALQARKDIAAAIDDLRAAQDKVRAVLRTQPFDEAALRQAMADVQARHRAVEAAIHDLIAGVAGQLSAEGRAKLAEWPRKP
jgi:uncharacterized membrane protein